MELSPTSYMLYSYPKELATLGPGHTELDTFKNTYVALMDKYHMKWWLEISDMMNDQSKLTYQTPGYNSTYYTPTSGMAKSYESSLVPRSILSSTIAARISRAIHLNRHIPTASRGFRTVQIIAFLKRTGAVGITIQTVAV